MSLIHHESLIEWPFVGAIGDPVTPTGIPSTATVGTPSVSLSIDLSGMGIPSTATCGSPSIFHEFADPEVQLSIYIGGEARPHLVRSQGGDGRGISRQMAITGGSKCTARFVLTNKHGFYRPVQGDEVIIVLRDGSRFFGGYVDKISEKNFSGSADHTEIAVDCVDYGTLLDRCVVGREYQTAVGNDPTILFDVIAARYFARFGITYKFTGGPPFGGLGDQVFNWLSGTATLNRICADSGGDWRVDFDKTLYLFGPGGYGAAPFSIEQDDGNWMDLTANVDYSRYRNRIYVKNSKDTGPLWTDSFTVAAGEFVWITMAPMSNKPIVRVDGTPATVVDYADIGTQPYDFYWIHTTVISNPASLPSAGTVIEVTYPSPLSHVAIAEDQDEIDEFGLFEGVEEVRDVPNGDALQAFADALLARRLNKPTTLTILTQRMGLESGMGLTVDVPRSGVSGTFLITAVTSTELGKGERWQHTVTAVDSATQGFGDERAFLQAMVASLSQARDRVKDHIIFQIAETVEGFDNPGLTVGEKRAVRTASVDGIAHSVSLYFNSESPTTDDCIIDVFQNGVSIFPSGDANKLIWPAGEASTVVKLDFLADPLEIRKGDIFTIEVLEADSLAKDGMLDLAMLVS
jgi:hypothetical protein